MSDWPDLDAKQWHDTAAALHLYSQILGKYRLAHTPWVNHSWHATLYVTGTGLTTGPVPDPGGPITLGFDFIHHRFVAEDAEGRKESFPLRAMSVSRFLDNVSAAIGVLGGTPDIHGRPNEIPEPVPFADDHAERPYDAEAVRRYHVALLKMVPVFERFRTAFVGKVSPVHLFWGSFDLAVTRFSGRPAPLHPGGIPNLPDEITREAYSHEVSSAGFWPGGGGVEKASFYSYAYPTPEGFSAATVEPGGARWRDDLGEFVLGYDDVRRSSDPEEALLAFLFSTYEAAAESGGWERDRLECGIGRPRIPREIAT